MDPKSAARILGGEARGNRVSCPGPGHSKSDRSLTIVFTGDGLVVHSFSTDQWQECKDYVKSRLGISDDWRPDPSKFKPPEDPDDRNFEFAMRIWEQSIPIGGTLAEKYLSGRAIHASGDIQCIRFHPKLKLNGDFHPAMIAIYRDIITNEPRGIQRTFLTPAARKIDRRMLGPSAGAAIKIDDDDAVNASLTIGEGLETVMSGRRIGYSPAWAVMSVSALSEFPVLPGISALTLLGEHDTRAQSQTACKTTARRWLNAGRDVFAYFPRRGKDMNDAIMAVGNG